MAGVYIGRNIAWFPNQGHCQFPYEGRNFAEFPKKEQMTGAYTYIIYIKVKILLDFLKKTMTGTYMYV